MELSLEVYRRSSCERASHTVRLARHMGINTPPRRRHHSSPQLRRHAAVTRLGFPCDTVINSGWDDWVTLNDVILGCASVCVRVTRKRCHDIAWSWNNPVIAGGVVVGNWNMSSITTDIGFWPQLRDSVKGWWVGMCCYSIIYRKSYLCWTCNDYSRQGKYSPKAYRNFFIFSINAPFFAILIPQNMLWDRTIQHI